MNARHSNTLSAIFHTPTPGTIRWPEIVALFRALGAQVREAEGSRVKVTLNEERAVFHRPHPRAETGRAAVRDIRDFLVRAGVIPTGRRERGER